MMTPVEKAGYFVGQWFEVIEEGNFIKGSIVELEDDDGSVRPRFNLVAGDTKCRIIEVIEGGSRKAYTGLDNIKPLPRTLKPLSELPKKWCVKVTPKQSEELQLALFEKGVTWLSGSSLVNHLKDSFLVFSFHGNNSLTRANSIESLKSDFPLLNYSELWNYETKEIKEDNEMKPKYELVEGRLPIGRSASDMGFKVGDKFEVVIDEMFSEGDIVTLTEDDNTTGPYFSRDSDDNKSHEYLNNMKPYKPQTVDESRLLALVDKNISLKEEIKELTVEAKELSDKTLQMWKIIEEKEAVIEKNTETIKINIPESIKKFKDYL